jgi:hypothetical protein
MSAEFKQYVIAPRESVWRPAVTTTLFPRLGRRAGTRFRITAALLILLVLGLAAFQLAAALIAAGATWLPVLFLVYLTQSGATKRISRWTLIGAALLGICVGVARVAVRGELVARTYDIPIATGLSAQHLLREGVAIPTASMLLMIIPVVLIRLRWRKAPESLDGFTIGAVVGIAFATAAILTRYAPQLAVGLLHRDRPTLGLVVESGINGVTRPITAAAVSGLVGVALWYSADRDNPRSGRIRWTLVGLAATALTIYLAEGFIDLQGAPDPPTLALHVALTALALVLLRLAMQLAIRTEQHPKAPSEPVLCGQCEHLVSGQTFCPECGAVMHFPGAQEVRLPSASRMAAAPIGAIAVALAALSVASALVTEKTPFYRCPPDCGQPPFGTPVAINPRYTAPNGAFSVSYPAPEAPYRVTKTDHGVTAELTIGDTGIMQLFARPAGGRSPKDIVISLVQERYPGAKVAYEIPNAMVGYEPGYGIVADAWPIGGGYARVRIVALAAIKHDLALIAGAAGPFHPYGPEFGPGKPTGTNLQIALDMGQYVNSFSWRGDPPR